MHTVAAAAASVKEVHIKDQQRSSLEILLDYNDNTANDASLMTLTGCIRHDAKTHRTSALKP